MSIEDLFLTVAAKEANNYYEVYENKWDLVSNVVNHRSKKRKKRKKQQT